MTRQSRTAIKINTTQEMITARTVLAALGMPPHEVFVNSEDMGGWSAVHVDVEEDGTTDTSRGSYTGMTITRQFPNLQAFLEDYCAPKQTPAQKELVKLEAQAEALNKQIAALKVTLA